MCLPFQAPLWTGLDREVVKGTFSRFDRPHPPIHYSILSLLSIRQKLVKKSKKSSWKKKGLYQIKGHKNKLLKKVAINIMKTRQLLSPAS